ncbi:MAG: pyruvate dehydrogenase (acetyl-transferring) component subunit alpha [Deltaproteobacteria bacterium]|nr:pyruvate dehydrogenase (acetyl-transferring) component subunit alpha [Deltaproteobacteria bacterium]
MTPTREDALRLLGQMLLIRRFEERAAEDYAAEKIRGFLHLYIGEEAVAVGVLGAIGPADAVIATYREHGHALARGIPPGEVMAEMYGRAGGCSRGHGGSMHLFSRAHRFYGGHGIVSGLLPIATGLALADRMRGGNLVTVAFFGEGASAEGEFHECLNLASLWRLPLLFVCENNLYAMGTALARSHAEPEIHRKAEAHRIESEVVDGMDVLAVADAATRAITAIRERGAPRFLECMTYRFRAHSMFDPDLYRDRAEVERWKERCPIAGFTARMRDAGVLSADDVTAADAEAIAAVDAARAFAEASPFEPVEDLLRDVYSPRGVA